jgi:hypothetical protein
VKTTAAGSKIVASVDGVGIVAQAGGLLLAETARVTGLGQALSSALAPWRLEQAIHDPGKIVLDLATALALGGDCAADIAVLRGASELFGLVASDPTVSRLIGRLAGDDEGEAACAAIAAAHARARALAWRLAAGEAPAPAALPTGLLPVDIDATLVTAHSDKQQAAPTFKRGFGFHPLGAFIDHGAAGTGETATLMLRAGNAGSNTAADHIAVVKRALALLPPEVRSHVLIRTDSAGGTKKLLKWLPRRRIAYTVGFTIDGAAQQAILAVPLRAWQAAVEADGQVRDGAWVTEITGMLKLVGRPKKMRVIVRKERPHPGAQLRFSDIDGHRFTCFATNTPTARPGTQLADLELRHRLRARAEDRVRCAKDTGLRNLPFHDFGANKIWCALVALATDLLAWAQMLALPGHAARRWEPKRLRLRLLSVPGKLTRHARTLRLHLAAAWLWADDLAAAITRLQQLPNPG